MKKKNKKCFFFFTWVALAGVSQRMICLLTANSAAAVELWLPSPSMTSKMGRRIPISSSRSAIHSSKYTKYWTNVAAVIQPFSFTQKRESSMAVSFTTPYSGRLFCFAGFRSGRSSMGGSISPRAFPVNMTVSCSFVPWVIKLTFLAPRSAKTFPTLPVPEMVQKILIKSLSTLMPPPCDGNGTLEQDHCTLVQFLSFTNRITS